MSGEHPSDPTAFGRRLADTEVHAAVLHLLFEMDVSARLNAPHAARIEPEWAETLAAKRARLEQMREGLGKSIAGKSGNEEPREQVAA